MATTDSVSDFLTRVRNACRAKQRRLDVPASRLRASLLDLLAREHFISHYKRMGDEKKPVLRIYLKYDQEDKSVIQGLRRVSSPGRRIYVNRDKLPRVMGGMGTCVVSTSSGILSDKEAREKGLGGEVVCYVW
ncbi:MAG TPA: 30S ribosomal protein S8 [Candidatus Saccharimonadales bacterium]|nr:30S ribosomal protein S8 [Candidatus Saccharimonadales bacterium]